MDKLPAELNQAIVDLIDDDDFVTLRNIRLLGRGFAAAAVPRLFNEVSIWQEEQSLQKSVSTIIPSSILFSADSSVLED